ALSINFQFFLDYVPAIVGYVFLHNLIALSSGYFFAWANRLPLADRRSIAIETGIQNSGIALVLIFGPIFGGLGGMALIAALWGIWHILAGLSLAGIWSRISLSSPIHKHA
ncbi:MAG: bile acid:sodium symporter family protein, partial [Bacteroidota bacterium]